MTRGPLKQSRALEKAAHKLSLDVEDIRLLTGWGRNAIYAAIKDGSLRAMRVGRRVLVARAILEEFLLERSRVTSGAGSAAARGRSEDVA